MDERFLEAFLNWPHTVMGRELRPFCLWHYINLEFAKSPFIGHPGEPGLEALAVATLICSSTPETDLRQVYPPLDSTTRKAWMLRQVRPYRKHMARERAKFAAYQKDHSSVPMVWESGSSTPLKSPWPLAAAARLQRYGGYTEFEAWTMSFGKAVYTAAALAEAGGDDPGIIGDNELKAMREAGWNV
jgi:hypothetical protein